jgi:hypothetical protein
MDEEAVAVGRSRPFSGSGSPDETVAQPRPDIDGDRPPTFGQTEQSELERKGRSPGMVGQLVVLLIATPP